jgi:hypothetical protein
LQHETEQVRKPAARPKRPLIQTLRRTSATVRTFSLDRVSGGEKARDIFVCWDEWKAAVCFEMLL